MHRACPHCGQEMAVFDEECGACGKPSKPGLLLGTAAILHGHRSWFILIGVLVASWFVLWNLFER